MITVGADLSVHADGTIPDPPALTVHGHITVRRARLCAVLGAPVPGHSATTPGDRWALATPAGWVRLVAQPGTATAIEWAVLATTDDVLPWVYKVVTGSTVRFPSAARSYFTESTVAGFAAAYADYLFTRSQGAAAWRNELSREDPRYQECRHLSQQLRNAANEVLTIVHASAWSRASDVERAAWEPRNRPVQDPRQSDLAHWQEKRRWLYPDELAPCGYPDLPQMLRATAGQHISLRRPLAQAHPPLDFALYDEHVATLQALAEATVPGIDTLTTPAS